MTKCVKITIELGEFEEKRHRSSPVKGIYYGDEFLLGLKSGAIVDCFSCGNKSRLELLSSLWLMLDMMNYILHRSSEWQEIVDPNKVLVEIRKNMLAFMKFVRSGLDILARASPKGKLQNTIGDTYMPNSSFSKN